MEQTKKLTLAELKAKANFVDQNEVLEKIQGGDFNDCHGRSGQIGKRFYDQVDTALDRIEDWLNS
ncbi:hypothetical protein [Sphingobacterium multivorum]|uniref:hypothetical protein n=1 Tax=Sphingobacterium multivorum TaxID=28454 RepID=UPI00289A95B2|nr:hypothetical protein [Sphingobacterium multivorum]